MDTLNPLSGDKPVVISVAKAAHMLGVHPNSLRRHFPLLRIGYRQLVRVEDLERFLRGERPQGGGHADAA